MVMLAGNHALPHNRGWSLLLNTKATEFKASHFILELKNHHSSIYQFTVLQTLMENIEIMIETEDRNICLSDMKTEIEHIIQSTNIHVLQEYLHTVDRHLYCFNESIVKRKHSILSFYLIAYHVLVTSEKENYNEILKVVQVKLHKCTSFLYLDSIFQLYIDMYYKDNPNETFTNIHAIWKSDPTTELNLKLAYCKNLIEAKDYKTLLPLIRHHADNLIECFGENEVQQCNRSTATMVLLHILHYQVSIKKMEKVKTIQTILSRKSMSYKCLINGFNDFLLTLDNKQLMCTPHVIKFILQPVTKTHLFDYLKIILLSSDRLRQANHSTENINFIKCHYKFISSFSTEEFKTQGECYYRQQYCITLLLLLNEYSSCHDNPKMNLMLTKLLELRVSFLSKDGLNLCYCFMGNQECSTETEEYMQKSILYERPRPKTEFEDLFLNCYQTIVTNEGEYSPFMEADIWIIHTVTGYVHKFGFYSVLNKVIQGELELAPYLQSITDIMSMNMYKDESVLFFIEFIEISANKNEESLNNIIKTLCAFDLQPEVQDLILQVLNSFLMISCNRQSGILSKFILDISMICLKGQFLYKLTSGTAKSLFLFDDYAVKDFKNIIYKCYCTVRHDCRNEKDANITKYKDHFTFIASMEAEEEMEKLTSLTNLLLLLTLLLIASGGHHKSAELKKYLSLKYEYRDSILYLLWCSGDVEINPGPTFRTLRKVPDSVKERNWIYEMCSMLLRLLKYRSIDIRIDGLWREKPLDWPVDSHFYDPRNKPKDKGYSIKTDRKLLENLEERCNRKGFFESKFDDEHTKSKVRQYKIEITAWKNNKTELFTLYTLRQEQDTLRAAKLSLHQYKNDSELHKGISDLSVDIIFDTDDVTSISSEVYTDIVRDIAITFCRIGKRLSPLEKSDGIWKMQPSEWNPNHLYYSPCNAGKRKEKGQDQKLVDNLLTYCESKDIKIPPELQPLVEAWKQRNTSEITKYYTIWSKTATINHSLKYLELQGILDKKEVQERLEQIGIKLDTQYWKCPSPQKVTYTDNDDKSQDSSFSDSYHSSPCTVNTTENITNSSPKVLSFPTINDNQLMKLTNSTNANLNAACDSSYCYDSHAHDHLCDTKFNLDNEWNQSSKHTCVSSCKDSFSILTQRSQPEADDKHHPISPVNFSNSKYQLISSESNLNEQLIPSTVYIHEDTSKPERKSNNISKTAKKRHRQNNGESCSEPKRLHVSEEDLPLFLQVLTSSSDNGKDIGNTSPKGNSNDCKITAFSTDHLSHDSISIKSKPNLPASGKQTDQLVINKLPNTSDGKPVDSSSYTQADNENKKGETTSDQWVNHIVNLLEEIEQDYSATAVEPSSGKTSSHRSRDGEIDNAVKNIQTTSDLDYNVKEMINLLEELDPVFISDTLETHKLSPCSLPDQPSDYSDEHPDHVESIIDELLNSDDTKNTFDLNEWLIDFTGT